MLVALSNHVIGDPIRMALQQQETPMSPAIVSLASFKHSLEFDVIAMSALVSPLVGQPRCAAKVSR